MNTNEPIPFDQLLLAAKFLRQQHEQKPLLSYCKFGEDYQDRLVTSKMHSVHLDSDLMNGANSTGSSRRSSPTSMFSTSSAHSSSPNSPYSTMLISQPISSSPVVGLNFLPASSSSFLMDIQQQQQNLQIIDQQSPQKTSTSTSPSNVSLSTRQSRAAHNELEKNRRANLRGYLDKLKTVLPNDTDSTRDTTLSLLTRARNHLRLIKEQKDHLNQSRNFELAENLALRQELEALNSNETKATKIESSPEPCSSTQKVFEQVIPIVEQQSELFKANYPASTISMDESKQQLLNEIFKRPSSLPPTIKTQFDLHMEGLLPALPQLYPYNNLMLHC